MLKVTTDGRKAALDTRLVTGQKAVEHPASSTTPPTPSPASGASTATRPTAPRPATPRRSPARCRSSSATSPPPTRSGGTPTTSCASCSPPAACPPNRSGSSTRRATTPRRPACSPPAAPATSRVLVGSTEKMGVGTNIQDRCIAIHHLDCPWRPADIEQRDGRGVRQGNQNPEIHIIRYATQGQLRHLQLADRRAQSPVHQPGHARPPRRPRDRGHRREHPQLRRGQSARLRRPADPRQRPRSTPKSPASPASSAPGNAPSTPSTAPSPAPRTAPTRSPSRSTRCARPPRSAPTPAATSSA